MCAFGSLNWSYTVLCAHPHAQCRRISGDFSKLDPSCHGTSVLLGMQRQWKKWDTQCIRRWKYQGRKKNKSTIYTLYAWIRIFRNSSAKGKCYLKCEFEGLIYLCLARGQGIQYVIGPKRVQLNWTCPVQGNEFQVLIDLGEDLPLPVVGKDCSLEFSQHIT